MAGMVKFSSPMIQDGVRRSDKSAENWDRNQQTDIRDRTQHYGDVDPMQRMNRARIQKPQTRVLFQEGGLVNIVLSLSVVVYRHVILAFDVIVFIMKTIGEYFRLIYRSVNPRPLRAVIGDIVLVTGAGHGIGRQVAINLAALGAIVVCVDINDETARKTAAEIKDNGGISWAFQCDVSKKECVKKLGTLVREEVGNVTVLINNAGIMITKQFMKFTDQEIENTVNVNLMGQIWMVREFLPAMVTADRGSIVFMCGLPGHAGAPYMVPYSASKFAIRGMMESLYIELRQNYPGNKLHLMLVSPFIVETGMVKRHRIRFKTFMGTVDVHTAAETICNSLRRRAAIVFIPEIFYYFSNLVRMLPSKVQLLLTDFFDTGIDTFDE